MQSVKSVLYGSIYGILTATVFSFFFVFFGQAAAGGMTVLIGEVWLYLATLPPFILGFALLGYAFSKNRTFNTKMGWLYSCVIAFTVTFFVSTFGSIIGHHLLNDDGMGIYERYLFYAQYGSNDNLFYWGFIYAVVLLPLTTVITRYFIKLFEWILRLEKQKQSLLVSE